MKRLALAATPIFSTVEPEPRHGSTLASLKPAPPTVIHIYAMARWFYIEELEAPIGRSATKCEREHGREKAPPKPLWKMPSPPPATNMMNMGSRSASSATVKVGGRVRPAMTLDPSATQRCRASASRSPSIVRRSVTR